ncbi:MAG: DMT family transporter [Bryobacterales bacterium]|nr:DMT family transporter [Bryobacterales bacterium]
MSAAISQPVPVERFPWRVYAVMFAITLMWSGNFVAVKYVVREMPPLLIMALRTLLAGAVMAPLFLATPRSAEQKSSMQRDFWLLAALGVAGVTLNQLFFTMALERTSVAHGSLIISTTPISVLLMASLVRQERLTAMKIFGMLLALSGVALIQLTPSKSEGATLLGDLLAMCGSLTFAAFTVFGKSVMRNHSSITINAFAYVGGSLLLMPAVYLVGGGAEFASISWASWLILGYMAVFPSVVCYVGYFYALNYIPASRVAVFAYLQPAIATFMAVPLLGETVSSALLMGGTVALAGVAITQRG